MVILFFWLGGGGKYGLFIFIVFEWWLFNVFVFVFNYVDEFIVDLFSFLFSIEVSLGLMVIFYWLWE